jgi:hypothetical protein
MVKIGIKGKKLKTQTLLEIASEKTYKLVRQACYQTLTIL